MAISGACSRASRKASVTLSTRACSALSAGGKGEKRHAGFQAERFHRLGRGHGDAGQGLGVGVDIDRAIGVEKGSVGPTHDENGRGAGEAFAHLDHLEGG